MMKSLAIAALALVGASTAHAMPATYKMTCQQAADLVASRGAVVLRTGAHTYDRYVAHQGYCGIGETTRPAWVPTKDSASCFVGYRCAQDNRETGGGF